MRTHRCRGLSKPHTARSLAHDAIGVEGNATRGALARRLRDPHDELLAGISEYCEQLYGNVLMRGIADPRPCDFVAAGLALKAKRELHELPPLPRDVVIGTFLYLVPDFER